MGERGALKRSSKCDNTRNERQNERERTERVARANEFAHAWNICNKNITRNSEQRSICRRNGTFIRKVIATNVADTLE